MKALGEQLSALQLQQLEEHRYTAVGKPSLRLYWASLLQRIPLCMAPNTITLVSLAIILVNKLIFYCPTGQGGDTILDVLFMCLGTLYLLVTGCH